MLFLIDGAYHLLHTVATLCELRGIDQMKLVEASKQLNDAINVLLDAVAQEQGGDVAYAHKRFFKSTRARKLIDRYAAKEVGQQRL